MENGAEPNPLNSAGSTPKEIAKSLNNEKIVRVLNEFGGRGSKDNNGENEQILRQNKHLKREDQINTEEVLVMYTSDYKDGTDVISNVNRIEETNEKIELYKKDGSTKTISKVYIEDLRVST